MRIDQADDADRYSFRSQQGDTGKESDALQTVGTRGEARVRRRVGKHQRRAALQDFVAGRQLVREIEPDRERGVAGSREHRQATVFHERCQSCFDAEVRRQPCHLTCCPLLDFPPDLRDESGGGLPRTQAGGCRVRALPSGGLGTDPFTQQAQRHELAKVRRRDRFAHEHQRSAAKRFLLRQLEPRAKNRRRDRRREVAAEMGQELEPIHPWHDEVEQDQIWPLYFRLREPLLARRRHRDLVARVFEDESKKLLQLLAVIDDENAPFRLCHSDPSVAGWGCQAVHKTCLTAAKEILAGCATGRSLCVCDHSRAGEGGFAARWADSVSRGPGPKRRPGPKGPGLRECQNLNRTPSSIS